MQDFIQKETNLVPGITCRCGENHLEFTGNSFPQNAVEFYAPLFKWLKEYTEHFKKTVKQGDHTRITINFKYKYVNSATSLVLRDIIQSILHVQQSVPDTFVDVNWYYFEEDVDMRSMGEELQSFFKIKFDFHMFD